MTRKAVYAGSFDPPTLAHLDVIERVAAIFDKLYVVLAQNSKKQYLLSEEERLELLKSSLQKHVKAKNIEVRIHGGLITDFCRSEEIKFLVRGMRAVSDFEGELAMATMNRRLNSEIDTIHVMTHPKYFFLSSSLVKEVALHGGSLEGLVPDDVSAALKKRLVK